jgi:Zn-dependent M28 family amino/carboxypeptidase
MYEQDRYTLLMHLPLITLVACLAQPAPQDMVDPDLLMGFIDALPVQRAAAGDEEHREGLRRAEALIESRLRELGLEAERQAFAWAPRGSTPAGQEPVWHNLTVTLGGDAGAEAAREWVVVGAHFDAVPGSPGADDNASGAAALLELARVLQGRAYRRTLKLVFFNAEEVGLVGSRRWIVEHAPVDRRDEVRVVAMLSLEMLGYFSDEPGGQRSPLPAIPGAFEPPTVGDFIALASTASHAGLVERIEASMRRAAPGLKVFSAARVVPDFPLTPRDILRSDHGAFLMAGLPGVMVTDTADFRNPHYHQPTDTIDTLDVERFTLLVRGLAGAVHELAGPVEAPATPGEPAKIDGR